MHWAHTWAAGIGWRDAGFKDSDDLLGRVFLAGFTCFYKRRTGVDRWLCCLLQARRFRLLCASPWSTFGLAWSSSSEDNVGLVLLLQPLVPEGLGQVSVAPLCVANTHPCTARRGDVKLAQMAILLAEVDKVARLSDGSHCPIVLCGDLNSASPTHLSTTSSGTRRAPVHGMPAWKVRWERPLLATYRGIGVWHAGLLLWQGPRGLLCCLPPAFSCPVDSSGTHTWKLGARECLWYTGITFGFIINLYLVYKYISKCTDVHKCLSIRIQALLRDSKETWEMEVIKRA